MVNSLEKRQQTAIPKEIHSDIKLTYKVMNVLGQILRSFPGSPGYRKRPLAEECYKLGMRLFTAALVDLQSHSPAVAKEFTEAFELEFPKVPEEVAKAHADSFIFTMGQMGAQSIINSIALSIGSPRLAPLYDEMLASDQSVSFKLVNACIKLNHFKAFPEAELVDIYNEVKEKHFTSTLLKMLAINALLRYPPSASKQQSYFSKLGISIHKSPQFLASFAKTRSLFKSRRK